MSGTSCQHLFSYAKMRMFELSYFSDLVRWRIHLQNVGKQMKGNALLAYPLTEAEIAPLEDFLIGDSVPEEAMDLSMTDGFITALASGPSLTPPSLM